MVTLHIRGALWLGLSGILQKSDLACHNFCRPVLLLGSFGLLFSVMMNHNSHKAGVGRTKAVTIWMISVFTVEPEGRDCHIYTL